MKIYALTTKDGTACLETALYEYEFTPINKAEIEDKFVTHNYDSPIADSWVDVSSNEAFRQD